MTKSTVDRLAVITAFMALGVAAEAWATDFNSLPNYTLECENVLGKSAVVLEVLPPELSVKLHNANGETISFSVTRVIMSSRTVHNKNLGNSDEVPFATLITLKDDRGRDRFIFDSEVQPEIIYSGGDFVYRCLHRGELR